MVKVLVASLLACSAVGCGRMTLEQVQALARAGTIVAGMAVVPHVLNAEDAGKVVTILEAARPAVRALACEGDVAAEAAKLVRAALAGSLEPAELEVVMAIVQSGLTMGKGLLDTYPEVVRGVADAASVMDAAIDGLMVGLRVGMAKAKM